MKTYSQFITELFNSAYNYKTVKKDADGSHYHFRTDKKSHVYIYIDSLEGKNNYEVTFTVDGTTVLTGEGDAFKILSTVISIMEEFMRKTPDMNTMEFDAYKADLGPEKTSRASLYDKMLKRFATKKKLDFKITDFGSFRKYIFKKK